MMLHRVAVFVALSAMGCSARGIEDEGQSRRHLAAEWCEDWCTFWYACEPLYAGSPVSECQRSCEGDEAWDWPDECGDIKWKYRECLDSHTCEELLGDPDNTYATPVCQRHMNEFVGKGCTYE